MVATLAAGAGTFRKTFPLYMSISLVPYVVFNLKRALNDPTTTMWRALLGAVRSTTFLAAFVSSFQAREPLQRGWFCSFPAAVCLYEPVPELVSYGLGPASLLPLSLRCPWRVASWGGEAMVDNPDLPRRRGIFQISRVVQTSHYRRRGSLVNLMPLGSEGPILVCQQGMSETRTRNCRRYCGEAPARLTDVECTHQRLCLRAGCGLRPEKPLPTEKRPRPALHVCRLRCKPQPFGGEEEPPRRACAVCHAPCAGQPLPDSYPGGPCVNTALSAWHF